MRRPAFAPAALCLLIAALFSLLGLVPGNTQKLGVTKGFKVLGENFEPPHETQPRSLLQGATAQSLPDGNQLLTGVQLETFNELGKRELLIQAPEAIYDRSARSAHSAGPLKMQTADGKFAIEGEGFHWSQTNSSLVVSNKVHTTIAADLLESQTNAPAKERTGPIHIYSDYFEYLRQTGIGRYRGNVRVFGTNQMSMASQLLEIRLPGNLETRDAQAASAKGLQSIRATEDVRLEYGGVSATGGQAFYAASNGVLTLTNDPLWRVDQRHGGARELWVDRTNKIFRATGDAWLRTPAQGATIVGLLEQTNTTARPLDKGTNREMEIRSALYEFRTNWAIFNQNVTLKEFLDKEVRGTMRCESLQASFKGTNELETLTARTNVFIQDGTNWLRCGLAVLTGSNAVLEATQEPVWGAGSREGQGDIVRIATRESQMLVRGNASLRVPAHELSQSIDPALATNVVSGTRILTNQFATLYCQEYVLKPENAFFKGSVHAVHPSMDWTCDSLSAQLQKTRGKSQTLVADGNVKFELRSNKGEVVNGTGNRAVYTYSVEGGQTNDVLTLTGTPATLMMTNGSWRNETVIYDRGKNLIRTPGNYSGIMTNKPQGTNLLMLPNTKLRR